MDKQFSLLSWKKSDVLVTAAIMAVILGISLVQLRESEMKTRDAQRKADTGLISRGLNQYIADHITLPAEADGNIVACGDLGTAVCEWGNGQIQDAMGIVYLKSVPKDPLADKGYHYVYERLSDGKLRIYTALEYGRDSEKKNNLTKQCSKTVQCSWYAEN